MVRFMSAIGLRQKLERRAFLKQLGAVSLGLVFSERMAGAEHEPNGNKLFRGLFPIAETPFTADDKLDLECLANEVRFCNRGRVAGFVWPQIASGWSTMTDQERLEGAEAILNSGKNGRTALVIGVQAKGADIAPSLQFANHAAAHGADAVISLPPENATDRAMIEYYKAIGAATPLPLFVQSQGTMSVDLIVEMFQQVPTMKCVKDEAGNPLARVTEIRERTGGKLAVFAGNGVRTMIDELHLGFSGYCPYPGLADLYQATFDLWNQGETSQAFDMFGRILAYDSIPGAEHYALVARGVFKETTTHRPNPVAGGRGEVALDATQKQFLRDSLDGFLKPYLRA